MSFNAEAAKQAFAAGLTIGVAGYSVALSATVKAGLIHQDTADEIHSTAERSSEIIATTAAQIKKADDA